MRMHSQQMEAIQYVVEDDSSNLQLITPSDWFDYIKNITFNHNILWIMVDGEMLPPHSQFSTNKTMDNGEQIHLETMIYVK